MRICAGNGLKCENVRETAKSAIPHPPHFIFASDAKDYFVISTSHLRQARHNKSDENINNFTKLFDMFKLNSDTYINS